MHEVKRTKMRRWLLFLPRNPEKPVGPEESSFQSEWKAQCELYTHLRYKKTYSTPKLSIDELRPFQKNCSALQSFIVLERVYRMGDMNQVLHEIFVY